MPDTHTPNLGLTKPCTRKNWAEAVNENFEKLGVLHYIHSDGSMFVCKNATYDSEGWHQTDTSKCSSLIQMTVIGEIVFYTCVAGDPSLSALTTIAKFREDGSLTLPAGLSISEGDVSVNGNITATGNISGVIAALMSLIVIDEDKNWNAKSITNIRSLQLNCLVSASGSDVLTSGSGGSSNDPVNWTDLKVIIVPFAYSIKPINTFILNATFTSTNLFAGASLKVLVDEREVFTILNTMSTPFTITPITLSNIRAGTIIRIQGGVSQEITTISLASYSITGSVSQTAENIGGMTNPTW